MTQPNLLFSWDDLPLISADLPGSGGSIRTMPEDFEVTELPLYPCTGDGEYLFILIEKREHTTKFVVDNLARQLGLKTDDLGVAGLKDRHAITRQWLSLPANAAKRLDDFAMPGVRVLGQHYHSNKLGMGHLAGNHFRLRVRNADHDALARAQAVLARLALVGVPNGFGPQRFGMNGNNAEKGMALVLDGKMRGPGSIALKRFLISSLQSLLFNHYLRLRVERGLFDSALLGDVMKKHGSGGVFPVENLDAEIIRAKNFETSAFGPLYGRKILSAKAAGRALEDEVLDYHQLTWEHFAGRKGARRFTRIRIENASIEASEDGYWIAFDLPKGSFATVVLREVMKVNVDAADDGAVVGGEDG
jgi:tRNA pseudouridine13 synthase